MLIFGMVLKLQCFNLIILSQHGAGAFNQLLYMGETRHRYYRDTVLSYLIILAGVLLIAELTYMFEQWKFKTFFPDFTVEAELGLIHNPAFLIVFLIVGICFSLLLTALGLRFSIRIIGIIIALFSSSLAFSIRRLCDAELFDAIADSGNTVLVVLSIMSLIAFLLSHRLIMRQSAK